MPPKKRIKVESPKESEQKRREGEVVIKTEISSLGREAETSSTQVPVTTEVGAAVCSTSRNLRPRKSTCYDEGKSPVPEPEDETVPKIQRKRRRITCETGDEKVKEDNSNTSASEAVANTKITTVDLAAKKKTKPRRKKQITPLNDQNGKEKENMAEVKVEADEENMAKDSTSKKTEGEGHGQFSIEKGNGTQENSKPNENPQQNTCENDEKGKEDNSNTPASEAVVNAKPTTVDLAAKKKPKPRRKKQITPLNDQNGKEKENMAEVKVEAGEENMAEDSTSNKTEGEGHGQFSIEKGMGAQENSKPGDEEGKQDNDNTPASEAVVNAKPTTVDLAAKKKPKPRRKKLITPLNDQKGKGTQNGTEAKVEVDEEKMGKDSTSNQTEGEGQGQFSVEKGKETQEKSKPGEKTQREIIEEVLNSILPPLNLDIPLLPLPPLPPLPPPPPPVIRRQGFFRGRRAKSLSSRSGRKEVIHKDEAIDPEDIKGYEHVERYTTPAGIRLTKFWDSEDELSDDESNDNFRRIMCGFGTNCRLHEVIRPASEIVRRSKEMQSTFGTTKTLPLFPAPQFQENPSPSTELQEDEKTVGIPPIIWHNDPSYFVYSNNFP